MMQFWIPAGIMLAVALFITLLPLLRKRVPVGVEQDKVVARLHRDRLAELEQEHAAGHISDPQYTTARQELEHDLLEEVVEPAGGKGHFQAHNGRWLAVVVACALPALALGMYMQWGHSNLLLPPSAPAPVASSEGEVSPEVQKMVEGLAAKLRSDPDNPTGWAMLGRSYYFLGRHDQAVQAFANAVAQGYRNPGLYADYADALASVRGQGLQGKPIELVKEALSLDPDQPKALWLAGTEAFNRGDYTSALEYWQRLQALLKPDSPVAQRIAASVQEAQQRSRDESGEVVTAAATVSKPDNQNGMVAAALHGRVSLAPGMKGKFADNATVFVFAKAANGPPMPLAVQRLRVADLPARFELNDSMAMSPALRLSGFDNVIVTARISLDGSVRSAAAEAASDVIHLPHQEPISIQITTRNES